MLHKSFKCVVVSYDILVLWGVILERDTHNISVKISVKSSITPA